MNVPPKALKRHVGSAARERNGGNGSENADTKLPAVSETALQDSELPDDLQRSAGSLPVLEAFQEFLEAERRRSRNRILAFSAVMLLILIVIGGGGGALGVFYAGRVKTDIDAVRAEMKTAQAEVQKNRTEMESALARIAGDAQALREDFAKRQKAMDGENSEVNSKVAAYGDEIGDLKKVIAGLEEEKNSIESELSVLRLSVPSISNDVQRILQHLAGTQPGRKTAPIPVMAVAKPPPAPKPAAVLTMEMPLKPAGSSDSVGWRMPIPE